MTMAYSVEETLQQQAQQQQQSVLYEETHFGNIGLGNALAVAYDLYNDSQTQNVQYPSYESLESDLYNMEKRQEAQNNTQQLTDIYNNSQLQNHYFYSNQTQIPQQQQQQQYFNENPIEVYSYLNPIPTAHQNQNSSFTNANSYLNYGNGYIQADHQSPASIGQNFFQQPAGLCNGQSSTSSSCVSPTSNNSINESSYSHQQIVQQQQQSQQQSHSVPTTPIKTKSSKGHGSSSSDDGVYEISEEEIQEIDDSLANNPEVVKSRHWKYYVETNEWTRATCALMACLFSREQMANSTVLGRGGAQRERLPTNLVAYVVTKIRRRFNRPAAAVRARMAQKCKDERRFGRLPSNNPNAQNGQSGTVGQKRQSNSSNCSSASKRLATKQNANSSQNTNSNSNASLHHLHHSPSPTTTALQQYAQHMQNSLLEGMTNPTVTAGDSNNNLINTNSNQGYSLGGHQTNGLHQHSNTGNNLIFQNQNLDHYASSHSPNSLNQGYLQHHHSHHQLYSSPLPATQNGHHPQSLSAASQPTNSSPSPQQTNSMLLLNQSNTEKGLTDSPIGTTDNTDMLLMAVVNGSNGPESPGYQNGLLQKQSSTV